jgi:exodeoxyribonuclease V beta subunit
VTKPPTPRDTFLQSLVAAHPAGDARNTAAWRLAMAAEAMDDAAVHTIDAWCQRMLREHAFDSGSLFDEELLPDPAALLAEAARDYWRQQVYPLDDDALATVLDRWPTVDRLRADVAPLQDLDLPADAGQGTLAGLLAGLGVQRTTALAALKAGWDGHAQALRDWLDAQLARSDCPFRKTSIQPRFYGPWLDTLRDWALGPSQELPDIGKGRERLTPQGLADALAAGRSLPALPPQIGQLAQLFTALDALPAPGAALRLHAAAQVAQRLAQLKRQAGGFGFMPTCCAAWTARWTPTTTAPCAAAARSASCSSTRWRWWTSSRTPRRCSCASSTACTASDNAGGQGRALLLIGDPKQAIYGFRGADIYSYSARACRHAPAGTTCWAPITASTQALVAAVNGLFERAEARPGEGAFMCAAPAAPPTSCLSSPWHAQGRPEQAAGHRRRRAAAADAGAGRPPARRRLLTRTLCGLRCAERIVTCSTTQAVASCKKASPSAPPAPADVAVLVRTGAKPAGAQRAAPPRRGVGLPVGQGLGVGQRRGARPAALLRAVARRVTCGWRAPRWPRRCWVWTWPELQALVDRRRRLRHPVPNGCSSCTWCGRTRGCWPWCGARCMLRPAGALAGAAGAMAKGRLTNVLHLAELLQVASAQLDGEAGADPLAGCRADDGDAAAAADEQVLRLESDADLVKVVTVHKSKGLEYPLVFLPFAALFRSADGTLMLPDAQGRLQLVLQPGDAQRQQAEDERLREDLRLLYVALTRARHALWVGAAALKLGRSASCRWHDSALGRLLSGPAERTPQQLCDDVAALHGVQGIVVQAVPDVLPTTALHPRGAPPPLLERPPYAGSFERHWAISSYSALVRAAERGRADAGDQAWPALARRVRDDEEPAPTSDDTRPPAPVGEPWHRFPRGALPATSCTTSWSGWQARALRWTRRPRCSSALRSAASEQGWGHRPTMCWPGCAGVHAAAAAGRRWRRWPASLPEMEFWFPSDGLQAAGSTACADSTCCPAARPCAARARR